MESFFVSTGIVALAEIGDKTQLLALILAARFQKPLPIIIGILLATLVNHGFAGYLGVWVASLLQPEVLRWLLGLSFFGMAIWMLVPDAPAGTGTESTRLGILVTTFVVFFLAEMGDKTQVATVALAAQYQTLSLVVAGTTLGMMIANVPAVYFGDRIAGRLPVRTMHVITAAIFVILGLATLLGIGERFGF